MICCLNDEKQVYILPNFYTVSVFMPSGLGERLAPDLHRPDEKLGNPVEQHHSRQDSFSLDDPIGRGGHPNIGGTDKRQFTNLELLGTDRKTI